MGFFIEYEGRLTVQCSTFFVINRFKGISKVTQCFFSPNVLVLCDLASNGRWVVPQQFLVNEYFFLTKFIGVLCFYILLIVLECSAVCQYLQLSEQFFFFVSLASDLSIGRKTGRIV